MASNARTFTLSPDMAPAAPLMRLLSRFDRDKVEAFAEISVAFLDFVDGDPDVELNGDEFDGSMGEDDFCPQDALLSQLGSGCPLSDPDEAVDDRGCDPEEGI